MSTSAAALLVAILGGLLGGLLTGCGTPPLANKPSPELGPIARPPVEPPARQRAVLLRERARWVEADWSELPGWGSDRAAELWPALLRGCARPAEGWAEVCAQAKASALPADDAQASLWLMQHLRPYRVESLQGEAQGLITGYYEPMLEATRRPQPSFQVPVHAAPSDLLQRRPYFTRQQIESDTALRARLKAHELAFLEDPLDLLVLQIQGS
ncbi:MltA domain-containing protein, partial [Roseateles sp.]|uniref:MltA domain-containing protein n=1 Tax=Roseateles sp. TaxID=1971397 RepID=UPI00286B2DF0